MQLLELFLDGCFFGLQTLGVFRQLREFVFVVATYVPRFREGWDGFRRLSFGSASMALSGVTAESSMPVSSKLEHAIFARLVLILAVINEATLPA